jgi:hypothetical protein
MARWLPSTDATTAASSGICSSQKHGGIVYTGVFQPTQLENSTSEMPGGNNVRKTQR